VKGSTQARDLITNLKPADFLPHPDGQRIGAIIEAREIRGILTIAVMTTPDGTMTEDPNAFL